jgi:hypothetical protein
LSNGFRCHENLLPLSWRTGTHQRERLSRSFEQGTDTFRLSINPSVPPLKRILNEPSYHSLDEPMPGIM